MTDKEELALQYQRGYTDGFLEAKRKYEKKIVDSCDMNVFEPEKIIQTPSCLTDPERYAELLERYKEE